MHPTPAGLWTRIHPWVARLLPTVITALVVVAVMGLVMWFINRWLRHLAYDRNGLKPTPASHESAHQLTCLIRRTLQSVAAVVVVLIVLRGSGVGASRLTWGQVSTWALGPGMRILFIFVGAFILVRITDFFVAHLQHVMSATETEALDWIERRKRIETLGRLMRALAIVIILGMAALMALREVHVDITPILTGAGVAGVAIGFGAQSVVKDIISGAFLILENQIRVGDVVTINGKTGLVETIRLRILVLRALDGTVYIFQNGAVAEISNLTKDYSYALLTVSVAYKEDVTRVTTVLEDIGKGMQADPEFRSKILAPLEILGVDSLAAAAVGIKVRIKTMPMEQWAVDRELRRRIKTRFDQEQIALV